MYLDGPRSVFFANENMVQPFSDQPRPQTTQLSTSYNIGRDPFGKTTKSNYHDSPYKNTTENDRYESDFETDKKDLGEKFVKVLLDEFKRVRKINTKDPKVLLDFWKMNRKTRQKEEMSKSMNKSYLSQDSQGSQRIKELQEIAVAREIDVEHTLDLHVELLKQEEKMKMFIMQEMRRRKEEEALKKKEAPRKMTKETLERLTKHPDHKQKALEKTLDDEKEKAPEPFIAKLMKFYERTNKEKMRLSDAQTVYEFWADLSNKENLDLKEDDTKARSDINKYFDEKYGVISEEFKLRYGYYSFDSKVVMKWYQNEFPYRDKIRREVEYDVDVLRKPYQEYCERKKKEIEEEEKKREEDMRKKEEAEREALRKSTIKKEIKATKLDELAKPKDNLKVGKALLFLRRMFPKDKILQRMLLEEFKRNKLSKYPEEYDVYDSDEEIAIRRRREKGEGMKFMTLADLAKPLRDREDEITEPFKDMIDQLEADIKMQTETAKSKKVSEKNENRNLERFIVSQVKKFLENRKKRLVERIPTLKEFLIKTYKDMMQYHKNATHRRFPHVTYGYSKRLKENSYPLEFKRYFFQILRSLIRGTQVYQSKILLPFWAPTSACAKSHMFLPNNASYNRTVNELSRETKQKKIEGNLDKKDTCWFKDDLEDEKMKVMMRFDDAKECTFAPKVGSKMPVKYKEVMTDTFPGLASEMLKETGSFEKWVNKMGPNFRTRYPLIFKYGKYKRAYKFYREGKYVMAYKEIYSAFHVDSIKKYFNPSFDPKKFKSVMFDPEQLKRADEKYVPHNENFEDPTIKQFLEKVYMLIMLIESYETNLRHTMKEVKKRLTQDTSRIKAKKFMCPLKDGCSFDIRPRWPVSKEKTITTFGHKCEFAHHTFELKFRQEVNAKKKILANMLDNLDKKLMIEENPKPFIVGGAKFTECTGCSQKSMCSMCQLRKGVAKKLEMYRSKAAEKFSKIIKKDDFKNKLKERRDFDVEFNKKIGFFRKALVLFESQRYRDAFENIVEAVKIIKEEKQKSAEKEEIKNTMVRKKLGIDPNVVITEEMIYGQEGDHDDEVTTTRSMDSASNLTKAKARLFAAKMGYIDNDQMDVNEFINHQIEEAYLKIEKALQDKVDNIELLKKKIDKLEGNEEADDEKEPPKEETNKMSESLSAIRRREKSLKSFKNKFDIDLVSKEKKIANLQNTIKLIKREMEMSKPPEAWKPTSAQDAILDIHKYDEILKTKKLQKSPDKKMRESSIADRKKKNDTIYERETDDLEKPPFFRTSTKF